MLGRVRLSIFSLVLVPLALVAASSCGVAQVPDLALGETAVGELHDAGDVDYYRITAFGGGPVPAGLHVVVTFDKGTGWYGDVCVRLGSLPDGDDTICSSDSMYDQAVEVAPTQAGYYYARVRGGPGPYQISAATDQTMPTLALGVPQDGEFTDAWDVRWYRVPVAAGEHLVVTLDKAAGWDTQVCVRPGAFPGDVDTLCGDWSAFDQALEVAATDGQDYFVSIANPSSYAIGSYAITAMTAEMLPTLELDTSQDGELADAWDVRWYRVPVVAGEHLVVTLDKAVGWYAQVCVRPGALPGNADTMCSDCSRYDQAVEVAATDGQDYFVSVADPCAYDTGSYTIKAMTADMMPTLTLGAARAGEIGDAWDVRWYRVQPPAGEHLMVFLNKEGEWDSVLCLSPAALPGGPETVCSACEAFDEALEVASTQDVDYFVSVANTCSYDVGQYSLLAVTDDITVIMRSVSPREAGNSGPVTVTVRGSGFQSGATVRACLSSDPATCVLGSDVTVSDPSELTARFDFGGAAVGSAWDVTVTNPDESTGTLLEAITLAEPVVNLWVDVLGPDRVRVGQETIFRVRGGNSGNVDAESLELVGLVWGTGIPEVEPGGLSGGMGGAQQGEVEPLTIVASYIGAMGAGSMVEIPVPGTWGPDCGRVGATLGEGLDPKEDNCAVLKALLAYYEKKLKEKQDEINEVHKQIAEIEQLLSDPGISEERRRELLDLRASLKSYLTGLYDDKANIQRTIDMLKKKIAECSGGSGSPEEALASSDVGGLGHGAAAGAAAAAGSAHGGMEVCGVTAIDPNEKVASVGYGGEGRVGEWTGNCPPDSVIDNGWVPVTRSLEYVIRFENTPSATAEAQDVVVTDTLDADLDWSSLEVGESRIAGQVYAPTVALDPGLRSISWTFSGVNLPPNQTPPEGEGSVSFSVGPAAGLPTGTEIGNYASIVFDVNPAMCTNAVLHIIDAESPTSAAEPLPAYQRWPLAPVRWAGEDGSGDSGVSDYALYASEDGGPAYLWHTSMTPTGGSAVFHGGYNHTYGFYSRARDHVQNLEGPPDGPDATITTGSGFIDIAEDDPATPEVNEEFWAFDEIYALALAKTSEGYEDETYRPALSVPRDQMAVYVARTLAGGKDKVPSGPAIPAFSDVASDYWAYDEIEYCHSQGVVEGYEDDTYRPTLAVNRGTMAVYMARAMVAPAGDAAVPEPTEPPAPHFPDVAAANESWCYKHVEYCYDHGVVKGYEDGTYRPGVQVHRDQMAVYVQRAFGLPM